MNFIPKEVFLAYFVKWKENWNKYVHSHEMYFREDYVKKPCKEITFLGIKVW